MFSVKKSLSKVKKKMDFISKYSTVSLVPIGRILQGVEV